MDPIVVSPFDAELFGHWWFEGPEFLNLFIRKSVYDQHDYQLTTPGALPGRSHHAANARAQRLELGPQGLLGSLAR